MSMNVVLMNNDDRDRVVMMVMMMMMMMRVIVMYIFCGLQLLLKHVDEDDDGDHIVMCTFCTVA